jgi:hypothetical protein
VDGDAVPALEAIDRLLDRLSWAGLERTTAETRSELLAVAQTAHAAGLIRLERDLTALGSAVARWEARDPLAGTRDLARALHRVWATSREAAAAVARGDEDPAILGEARRKYVEVPGPVSVVSLGASGWVSDSGYVGVTVILAGPDGMLQASNARPSDFFGRDPSALLSPGLAGEGPGISDLLHGAFVLSNVKKSADNRLSLHRHLHIEPAPWPGALAYAAVDARDAVAVLDRVAAAEDRGVQAEVLFHPTTWGPVRVDEKRQEASLELGDAAGAEVRVQVPLKAENNRWIDNLERLVALPAERKPIAVFGRAWISGGRLRMEPFTAVWDRDIGLSRGRKRANELHLSLESLDRVSW